MSDLSDVCEYCGEYDCACEIRQYEDLPKCGCKFCMCSVKTEYGEPCAACAVGVHQGVKGAVPVIKK